VTYTATVGAPVTGSPVVVTLANGQTITIAVGQTTGTVTATAPNDALTGHAPLTTSITEVSGGNYENLVADKTPVSTTVTDEPGTPGNEGDVVKVTITADQVSVAENVKPTFTVHINTALAHDLVVTLSNNATVTIKAGETSAPYTHEAQGDDVYKDAGNVQATIKTATGGSFENLVTSTAPAVTSVTDTIDTTTVKLTATGTAAEGGTVTYTATVGAQVTGSPVTVTLANGQTIVIPVGESSNSVDFKAPDNALNTNVDLTNSITKVEGGNYEKLEHSTDTVTTTVTDDPSTPTETGLSLTATGSVSEGGQI
ncbi:MAG: hypothetical protein RSE44_28435, partial [Pseudomonas sp.]